ncbi:MAG TPA: protocatechuate 3,4-dioxygenase [Microvirga sp.]|jgi:protocatechuate 3,4-dioxygenase beta subunit|nr:protocatechuate 3,4-dioxygenase [Microvirga sp.]
MVQSRILIDRRSVVLGGAAGLIVPKTLVAAERVPTPGQTEGPFYPTEFPADMDNDLVRVAGQAAQALGQVTLISGHVVDMQGQPQRGTTIEIWQCDAKGIYRHPRAPGQGNSDTAFQGYGRTQVDSNGAYRFRTIRPVPYPGRTPHIHFAVHVPGRGRLVTQMYIEGEPLNARDGLLNGIRDQRARRSVLVALSPATGEAGALQGQFDIVVA